MFLDKKIEKFAENFWAPNGAKKFSKAA